jgi:hypothetical protein
MTLPHEKDPNWHPFRDAAWPPSKTVNEQEEPTREKCHGLATAQGNVSDKASDREQSPSPDLYMLKPADILARLQLARDALTRATFRADVNERLAARAEAELQAIRAELADIRYKTLEEAARVAEKKLLPCDLGGEYFVDPHTSEVIAAAIRALSRQHFWPTDTEVARNPKVAALVEAASDQLQYMDACNDKGDLERNLRAALAAIKENDHD